MTTERKQGTGKSPTRQGARSHKRWGSTPEDRAENIAKALDMRRRQMIYDDIAKELGVSCSYAHELVQDGLRMLVPIEAAEDLRKIEAERLDKIRGSLYPAALDGDHAAVDRWLKVSESLRKLLGIDMPAKVEVEMVTHAQLADELAAYLAGVDTGSAGRLDDAPVADETAGTP